ncbi:hypothetical protein M406DRAFT_251798 [Cryphonectria parasitica EP155]|uniref:Reverse transcriptase domain-containing protein n=1 Tax=Cryphonectria parasitica (strain ATCC 38755 / EP155) TaxID=660469 RepID=A0A9P4Y4Y2_CRYP1|nr:uncharacterized protein M406DRAFT_251798 [Cryphonectria parasitica EP155]KAF3766741.1 hypothetical protein M406DRAFT_251798 [Cryphonectria parasitica EP155]
MDRLLYEYKYFIKAFINDIIIFSNSFINHLKHFNIALSIFDKKEISIFLTKSYISFPSIKLLSFYINALGLFTTKEHTEAF